MTYSPVNLKSMALRREGEGGREGVPRTRGDEPPQPRREYTGPECVPRTRGDEPVGPLDSAVADCGICLAHSGCARSGAGFVRRCLTNRLSRPRPLSVRGWPNSPDAVW